MNLATVRYNDNTYVGFVDGANVAITAFTDCRTAIGFAAADPGLLLRNIVTEVPVASTEFLAPLQRPGKILGCGANYPGEPAANPGKPAACPAPATARPAEPRFFSKLPSSVIGTGGGIRLPAATSQVEIEVELAIVIGISGRDIPEATAMEHVFGFTVVNDVSCRDVLARRGQQAHGKGYDTFCPMGPCIVSRDELPQLTAVRVQSWINDVPYQDDSTARWRFTASELIAHASRRTTLEAGDVITTGTPPTADGTHRWLAAGDTVTVAADGIGSVTNHVVPGW